MISEIMPAVSFRKLWLLAVLCCSVLFVDSKAFALSAQEHIAVQGVYVWGLTTESSRAIHSSVIDTVPWRINANGTAARAGGGNHRNLWGHSDAWFYEGRIPKTEALEDIRRSLEKQYPKWSNGKLEREAIKVYKEAVSISGQERIARELIKYNPMLSKKEAMAAAEQLHAAHLLGDSTTAAGVAGVDMGRVNSILTSPSLEAVTAWNKMSLAEAIENGGSVASYVGQSRNFERLLTESYMREGYAAYNPPGRGYLGISTNRGNYIIRDTSSFSELQKDLKKLPGDTKIMLSDDNYEKFCMKCTDKAVWDRVCPASEVVGDKRSSIQQKKDMTVTAENIKDTYLEKNDSRLAAFRRGMKKTIPYITGGIMMSLTENWDLLNKAYNGDTTWSRALGHTAVDFAGYTVTPMLIDGLLSKAGDKLTAIMPLKGAGMGYTLAYFCWDAGKEFLAYQTGDISYDNFISNMKRRGARSAREVAMIPVNMLVLKLAATAGVGAGAPLFVPIVIIGGSFAIQRTQAWYEEKRLRNVICLDDVRSILGDDMVEEFTLLSPEYRPNLAEPERRPNLAEPERRSNLAEPERRPNLAEPERW